MQPFTRNRLIAFAGACFMGMSFNLQAHENGGVKNPKSSAFKVKAPINKRTLLKMQGKLPPRTMSRLPRSSSRQPKGPFRCTFRKTG